MKTTICNRVCAFLPPYVLDEQREQIFEDYANPFCQCSKLFSHFPADTTMHPVLKSLGITDTVISFIMESVKGNKVKTNRCVYWMSYIICAHVQPGDVVETHIGVHDGRMKWPVLVVSDRPWSPAMFFHSSYCSVLIIPGNQNQKLLTGVIIHRIWLLVGGRMGPTENDLFPLTSVWKKVARGLYLFQPSTACILH